MKGDDRHRPVGVAGLDQLDELLDLLVDPGPLPHPGLKPEDQLVEEQHHAVVAERPGVLADLAEPVVERYEGVGVAGLAGRVRLHGPAEQGGHQPGPALVTGGRVEGGVQLGAGPGGGGDGADGPELVVAGPDGRQPVVGRCRGGGGGQQPYERLVAERLPQRAGVGEQRVRLEHGRGGLVLVLAAYGLDVSVEQCGVQAGGAHQVVGHHQEPLPRQPVVVVGDDLAQPRLGPHGGIVVEHGVQHGQEVALAGAERSMQVGGVRRVLAHGPAHQPQRGVELLRQLLGDHVVGHRAGGLVGEPLGQGDLEVTGVGVLLDVEDVFEYDAARWRALPRPGHSPGPTLRTLRRRHLPQRRSPPDGGCAQGGAHPQVRPTLRAARPGARGVSGTRQGPPAGRRALHARGRRQSL